MLIKETYKKMRYAVRDIFYNTRNRKKLLNNDFSIISNDCVGGCIAKDLRIRFNSPTRNLYFDANDYIKFCQNLDLYPRLWRL